MGICMLYMNLYHFGKRKNQHCTSETIGGPETGGFLTLNK